MGLWDDLQASLGGTDAPDAQTPQWNIEPKTREEWEAGWGDEIATGLRIGGPILGLFLGGGPFGAAVGGALGDYAAQQSEIAGGVRTEYNPYLTAGEAFISGIPGARVGSSMARKVAQEAAVGTAAASLEPVMERGELPGLGSVVMGASMGAGAGRLAHYFDTRFGDTAKDRYFAWQKEQEQRAGLRAQQALELDTVVKREAAERFPPWVTPDWLATNSARQRASVSGGAGPEEALRLAEVQANKARRTHIADPTNADKQKKYIQAMERMREAQKPLEQSPVGRPRMGFPTEVSGSTALVRAVINNVMNSDFRVLQDRMLKMDPNYYVGKKYKGQHRLVEQFKEGLKSGEVFDDGLITTLARHGMSVDEFNIALFADDFHEKISDGARMMSAMGSLKKEMKRSARLSAEFFAEDPVAAAKEGISEQYLSLISKIWNRADTPEGLWDLFMEGGSWGRYFGNDMGRGLDKVFPAWPGFRHLDQVRRKLMVTQVKTTVRNILTQTPRYFIYAIDEGMQDALGAKLHKFGPFGKEHGIQRMKTGNGMEAMYSFFGLLAGGKRRKEILKEVDKVLDVSDRAAAELLRSPAGEVAAGKGVADILNTFNRIQEHFFRRAAFHSKIQAWIKNGDHKISYKVREGRPPKVKDNPRYTAKEVYENPSLIPKDVIDDAVDNALDVTFAATPTRGLGKAMVRTQEAMPLLNVINPYPRFVANSWKFLVNFSPLAFTRITSKGGFFSQHALKNLTQVPKKQADGTVFRSDDEYGARLVQINKTTDYEEVENNVRRLSQGAIGTAILAVAGGIDQLQRGGVLSEAFNEGEDFGVIQGDKWYNMRTTRDMTFPGTDVTVAKDTVFDFRSFAPLSQMLFFTKLIRGVSNTLTEEEYDGLQHGEQFDPEDSWWAGMLDSVGMSVQDFYQGVVQLRVAGAMQGIFNMGNAATQEDAVKRIVGEVIGGYTVGFQTLKDLLAGTIDPDEAVYRDTRSQDTSTQLMGRFFANIPGTSQFYPPAASPTETRPRGQQFPLFSQLTGVNIREQAPFEAAMSAYNIPSRALGVRGRNPEFKRLVTEEMGRLLTSDFTLDFLENGLPHIKSAHAARLTLENHIKNVRNTATYKVFYDRPDLAAEKRLPSSEYGKLVKQARYISPYGSRQYRYGTDEPLNPQRELNGMVGNLFDLLGGTN